MDRLWHLWEHMIEKVIAIALSLGLVSEAPFSILMTICQTSNGPFKVVTSNDGITWANRAGISYTPANAGGYVHDPSVAWFSAQSKLWLVHTNTICCFSAGPNTSFDLASSTDGFAFSAHGSIDMSAVVSGSGAAVWAPEWIHNPDGTPWLDGNGLPHVIVAASNSGANSDTGFQLYETHPTNANDFTAAWSTPVAITGTSLPNNMIDPYPIAIGSNLVTYYKNENTKYVERMQTTLSALTSGNTVTKSGDWAGWGKPLEGESVLQLAPRTWRIILDAEGAGIYYSDSTDDGDTWSAKTLVAGPGYTMQHGTMIFRPPSIGN